jgi:DNA repair protein RecN (Recombination protein N)
MLNELQIRNFAIIEQLSLELSAGLVIFTGETGAGKSIIFDAVEALLGGRVDPSMVRSGANQALVEGEFQVTPETRDQLHAILEREDLLDDPQVITLAREIRPGGRSVARVNGRSVNVALLRELGEILVDMHGQSEHLSLLRTREHLGLLDRYSDILPLQDAYGQTYRRLQAARSELQALQRSEKEIERRVELLTYQLNEIESARLQPDEEEALRSERTRLANAEGLASLAQQALVALDESSSEVPAATDLIGQVLHDLNALARLDPTQTRFGEQAGAAFDLLSDLSRDLRQYLEAIEFNPRRLDQVEERLNLIQTLKRKYGGSVGEALQYAQKARQELESISRAEERLAELHAQENALLTRLAGEGLALSKARREAAARLAQAIQLDLDDLRMTGAQFSVDFQHRPDPNGAPLDDGSRVAFTADGLEQVEFLIAPNPGEGFKPLVKIASGGETSRMMLALKNVLARADHVPTLIFDEIDQGIGGRVGVVVGQKLWQLARRHQVLCITHLPQLAAFGDQHHHVAKTVQDGRTLTQIETLAGERRLLELAQMFGEVSSGTLHSAQEILQTADNLRR